MSSKVTSIGLKGLEGYFVTVEVQTIPGIHSIVIVGLPDASVKESKQRMVAAFHSLDYFIHQHKIIINLSPSEQKKNGPLFDLPMAIGILLSLQEINVTIPHTTGFIGAISLDGSIQPARGMLPAILAAKKLGLKKLYLPFDDGLPSFEYEDIELIFVRHLLDVVQHLSGRSIAKANTYTFKDEPEAPIYPDFDKIIGHSFAKHALEIAAAGGHHVFMSGPPGCGKSLLAESFPSILPPLSKEARFEVMSIYQLSGQSQYQIIVPPFRSPHHTSSGVSIIGGGQNPKPGEISLAHHGVLFLDEIAEFPRKTLEMLRQPLETGKVSICRAKSSVTFPSSFILIAAMNPCPCGYLGSTNHYCICSPKQIAAYQNKISGPMRDRFDIFLTLSPINLRSSSGSKEESSQTIRQRVEEARIRQYNRYGKEITNGRIPYETILQTSPLSPKQENILQNLAFKHGFSNRSQIKIIRIARTIADLQSEKEITEQNIWEAIKYSRFFNPRKFLAERKM